MQKTLAYVGVVSLALAFGFIGGLGYGRWIDGKDTGASARVDSDITAVGDGVERAQNAIDKASERTESARSGVDASRGHVSASIERLGSLEALGVASEGSLDRCIELASSLESGLSELQGELSAGASGGATAGDGI
jgi:hypothetical protein